MKSLFRYSLAFLLIWIMLPTPAAYAQSDSTTCEDDSSVLSLRNRLHELNSRLQDMNMQNIMLREELQRTGNKVKMDSISRANRRRLIDSLRNVTPGAPLVAGGDTLFCLYARCGGLTPEARAAAAAACIEAFGHRLTLHADTLVVYEGDFSSDIMAAGEVLLSITDTDALWAGQPRSQLAHRYKDIIQAEIHSMHAHYGLQRKLWGLLLAAIVVAAQVLLLVGTNRLFRRWKRPLMHRLMHRLRPVVLKDYEFLNVHRQGIILMTAYKTLRYLLILFQLFLSIPLLFSIFPETETMTLTMLGYIWNPFKDILLSIVNYVPKLCQIIVIWACFHYLLRLIRYFADEIERENLRINGFYPDWAKPSYYILRVLLYSLMTVMIWPLLPSSDSQIFQGVSVFIGIVVSLGSTSIVGNLMAGLVMTYMRPFRIGDYIKVDNTVGEVIEKTVLVTRIRTRKNEVITIQNSSLMGSQTSNFSVAARNFGIIVHTKVTIGYDEPWQKIKDIMESAALATPGILSSPKPFMMITSLDDFYVEYEINAYTDDAVRLTAIYSELHAHLLRRFFEEGVEIMSPHIYARRDGLDLQMPPEYKA